MTLHLGNVPANSTLYIPFASYGKTNGESITLTGLAVTDIEIYKNGSVTQRASDAGYTLLDTDGIDFDGLTGIHGFSIDLSDNTDASFYAVGSFYWVVVSSVTIDSQTVNFIAATFRIVAAEAIAGKPKVDVDAWLGTAAATPSVAGVPEVDLTHVAGATTNVAALATNVDAILTDTADMQPKLGTPAGASVSADIAAVKVDTAAILFDTGTTLDGKIDAIDNFIDTEIADIQARLPAALVSGRIDASVGAMAANVMTAAAAAADLSAEIADAVWDEALAGHAGAGSTGEALAAAGSAGDPWITALPGAYSAGSAGYILGTNLNATISSRLASASYTAPLDAAGTRSAVGLASANLDTQLAAIDDYLDTELAAVKAKTDNLPASPAAVGSAMTLTSGERDSIAAALLDLSDGVETSITPRQAMRAILASVAGVLSGAATTTITLKNPAGGTTRLTVTVDEDGNRSAVVTNL